jgi:hypothetical protein
MNPLRDASRAKRRNLDQKLATKRKGKQAGRAEPQGLTATRDLWQAVAEQRA